IFEDETVAADTFFFNEVVDNSVYAIPAKLLSSFVSVAITYNCDTAGRVIADFSSYTSENSLSVSAESYVSAGERYAGEVTDTAVAEVTALDEFSQLLAACRLRAFTYAVSVNRLALSWSDKFFISVVRNTVTVGI